MSFRFKILSCAYSFSAFDLYELNVINLANVKCNFFLYDNSLRLTLQTPNTVPCNVTTAFVTPTSLWANGIYDQI